MVGTEEAEASGRGMVRRQIRTVGTERVVVVRPFVRGWRRATNERFPRFQVVRRGYDVAADGAVVCAQTPVHVMSWAEKVRRIGRRGGWLESGWHHFMLIAELVQYAAREETLSR